MKSNTCLTIEIYGLLIGLLGAQVIGLGMLLLPLISNTNNLAQSSQTGMVAISLIVLFGVIGSVFFLINLYQMRLMRWNYRLGGFVVFYGALAMIGVFGS